jgi:hypothetical protein
MTMRIFIALILVSTTLLGSCDSGTPVVLNERLFELPSMKFDGAGCTMYRLGASSILGGGGSSSSSGGSAAGLPLVVEQRSDNDRVIVDVTANGSVVVEKVFDLAFFESGKLDEFTASAPGQTMLLRYWGDASANPQCAPLTDDGSRPASP